jgi:hypothetical protein
MLLKYFDLESCQLHLGILKLFQEPHVIFVEEADVVDAVAEHGDFKMAAVVHKAFGKAGVSILPAKVQ